MIAVALGGWGMAVLTAGAAAAARGALARTRHAVAVAEHELRGPLTAIGLGVESGRARGVMGQHQLRAMGGELDRVRIALDDLGRARTGHRPRALAAVDVDLHELVTDSVRAWQPPAAAAGVRLELEWEGGGEPVRGDRVRLAQATENLIANAIEHGGDRVRVTAAARNGGAHVRVADGGPGLAPGVVALAARRGRRNQAARGHGLAVAAEVARAHGGRLLAGPAAALASDGKPGGASLVLELPTTAH